MLTASTTEKRGSAFDSEGVGGGYLIPEGFVEAGRGFGLRAVHDDELAKCGQVSP